MRIILRLFFACGTVVLLVDVAVLELVLGATAPCRVTVNGAFTLAVRASNRAVPCGRVNSVHVIAYHRVLGEDWAVLVRALYPFGFDQHVIYHLFCCRDGRINVNKLTLGYGFSVGHDLWVTKVKTGKLRNLSRTTPWEWYWY